MAVLNHGQLETLWESVGGPGFVADTAAAIAQAESGGSTTVINNTAYPRRANYHPPSPGSLPEYSVGLWQINMVAHPQYTQAQLLTQKGNATAALAISNHGTNFDAWSTYDFGAPNAPYRKFLVAVPAPPPGTIGVPTAASASHQVDMAWSRLMRTWAIYIPQQLAVSAAARSRIRQAIR